MVMSCGSSVRDFGVGVVASDLAGLLVCLSASARVRREGGLREGGVDGALDWVAASDRSAARSGVDGMDEKSVAREVPEILFRRPMLIPSPMRPSSGLARPRERRGMRDIGPLPVDWDAMLLMDVSELKSMRSPVGTEGKEPRRDSTSASPVRSALSV